MPKVNYLTPTGVRIEVTAAAGRSVMRAAIENNVPGIKADCGGECGCATCHVYVDPGFRPHLPPPAAAEEDMLAFVAAERNENSRLACQIVVSDELDGLTVRVPERQ